MSCDVSVPQGRFLGPVLFNCIMSALLVLLDNLSIRSHVCADNMEFWVNIENEVAARGLIAKAFLVIESFMYDNHLKLDPGKTRFIPFPRKKEPSSYAPLVLNDQVTILPSCEAWSSESCLVFRGGQQFKAEGCQSTGAMHPWYSGTPRNKFVLTSVV